MKFLNRCDENFHDMMAAKTTQMRKKKNEHDLK